MKFNWKQTTPSVYIFFDENEGKIYGKIISTLSNTSYNAFFQNMQLGEYVTLEHAKRAVENPANFNLQKEMMEKFSAAAKP
jgi:hypothetical protein